MRPYYEADGIVIYHGDALEVLPALEWGLAVTDPPYGVGFQYASYHDTEEAFRRSVLPVVSALVESGPAAVFMSMKRMQELPTFRWPLCWYKPGSTRRNAVGGFSIWEPVFLYGDGWRVANDAIRLPDCVNHDKGNEHPCPKPLDLIQWVIGHHSGAPVLDPFMGSGTTLVAAKNLGRQAIGVELEERYCEIAARRLDQGVLDLGGAA